MEGNEKQGKKQPFFRPGDILFPLVVVAAVLLIWFYTLPKEAGQTVEIRQDGKLVAALPLSEDARYEVAGAYRNVFVVSGGEVYVAETNCPNHQCERSGAISRAGQSIVCAPNKVTATITGGEAQVDGVTG